MIKVVGLSNLDDINEAIGKGGRISVICGRCSKPLLEGTKKITVNNLVYCEKDAFVAAKQFDSALKDKDEFEGRLFPFKTKGWKDFHFYASLPGSKN